MDTAPQIVPPFAPEERYVYSSATHPIPALQRSAMCALSQSRINTDSAREGDSVLPFAPEERYVYSSATHPIPALQRSAMCALSQSRINTDSAREGDSVLPFAPEERYVYSSATHPTRAPEERNVVLSHTIELVGVGCPNPSGEATPPLRLPTYRSPAIRLALRPVSLHLCALCVK